MTGKTGTKKNHLFTACFSGQVALRQQVYSINCWFISDQESVMLSPAILLFRPTCFGRQAGF
jgi:hypothetical protein